MNLSAEIVELSSKVADAAEASDAAVRKVEEIRSEILRRRRELRTEVSAPVPIDDAAVTNFPQVVRNLGDWLIDQYGGSLIPNENRTSLLSPGAGDKVKLPPDMTADAFALLCAGAPELAESILRTLAEKAMKSRGKSAGSTSADRPALIARLSSELEALERDEEALIDKLAEAKIVIPHRPEVAQRRAREQEQARAREQREREHLERQRRLDEDRDSVDGRRPQQPGDFIISRG